MGWRWTVLCVALGAAGSVGLAACAADEGTTANDEAPDEPPPDEMARGVVTIHGNPGARILVHDADGRLLEDLEIESSPLIREVPPAAMVSLVLAREVRTYSGLHAGHVVDFTSVGGIPRQVGAVQLQVETGVIDADSYVAERGRQRQPIEWACRSTPLRLAIRGPSPLWFLATNTRFACLSFPMTSPS